MHPGRDARTWSLVRTCHTLKKDLIERLKLCVISKIENGHIATMS